ncbi:MAG: hypothetical protein COA66_09195 [Arcobacter sp.]|nr:MAG: hypothetical protein COA66_09195 [Arcobacter sp.]
MHKNEYEDFEVVNTGNSTLLKAITYFNDNFDAPIIRKLKKTDFINSDEIDTEIISHIMELMTSDTNKALFRKSNSSNDILTNMWMSQVQKKAKLKFIGNVNVPFKKLSKQDLKDIAECSYVEESVEVIVDYLYEKYGIILVIVSNIEGMKTDGATFLLENQIPVIGMSLRINRYDYFWFTLMHELSHVYLHLFDRKLPIIDNNLFGDETHSQETDEIEIEANTLARDSLIPRRIWAKCKARKYQKDEDGLLEFSNKYKVHKSIVAGFIRYEQMNYKIYNKFITKIY